MSEAKTKGDRCLAIMGIRGVPADHGGFETFAARLAPYLATHGWRVTVYCQVDQSSEITPPGKTHWESTWQGVRRVHIAVPSDTAFNSIRFDWKCIAHAVTDRPDVVLVLGYNTATFTARLRLAGIPTVFNMDGVEWARAKWSGLARAWLYCNERAACVFGNHLIADHPHIEHHLRSRTTADKISVIPYGAELIDENTDCAPVRALGLTPGRYATLIARPEPENSILPIVRAFAARKRGMQLVVLGRYHPDLIDYHAEVLKAGSDEVLFVGGIYDRTVVDALRRHSMFYLHGHRVGGCNPSLLEAMGAANLIVAHDNRFNRWVAGESALYFTDETSCDRAMDRIIQDPAAFRQHGAAVRSRAAEVFNWASVLQSYAELLRDALPQTAKPVEMSSWGRRPLWQSDADMSDTPQVSDF